MLVKPMPHSARISAPPDSPKPAKAAIHPGVLRVAPMIAMPGMLRAAGVDPAELLAEFGLPVSHFEDPDNVIAFTTLGSILSRCVERTRCEHFGLLVGQQWGSSVLGPVGYLIQSAPDVHSGLAELATYLHVHDGGAVVTLVTDAATASLGYEIIVPGVESAGQILDAAMAIGFNILREMCGVSWRPLGVQLAHFLKGPVEPFRKFFGLAPSFDEERTAIVFAKSWLDTKLAGTDPFLHRMMADRIVDLKGRAGEDMVDQVRRILRSAIGSPALTLESVAQHIGINARTLNRRLAAEATSFREVRDTLRWEIACQLLANTRRPACEIAEAMGFADAASFNRAFRRRSGLAPGQWRAARRVKETARSR
jgi:AraC-like DNA-binding protein